MEHQEAQDLEAQDLVFPPASAFYSLCDPGQVPSPSLGCRCLLCIMETLGSEILPTHLALTFPGSGSYDGHHLMRKYFNLGRG